jgi:hypothetical protein
MYTNGYVEELSVETELKMEGVYFEGFALLCVCVCVCVCLCVFEIIQNNMWMLTNMGKRGYMQQS